MSTKRMSDLECDWLVIGPNAIFVCLYVARCVVQSHCRAFRLAHQQGRPSGVGPVLMPEPTPRTTAPASSHVQASSRVIVPVGMIPASGIRHPAWAARPIRQVDSKKLTGWKQRV